MVNDDSTSQENINLSNIDNTDIDPVLEEIDDETTKQQTIYKSKDTTKQENQELKLALKTSKLPIQTTAKLWKLKPFLIQNLNNNSIEYFFPIQCLVINDFILSEESRSIIGVSGQHRDICVNAPTGSGKTLAFVIPILHLLSTRRITHIRALIVLPSRDLAQQVYKVFTDYCKGSTLKIGLCTGGTTTTKKKRKQIDECSVLREGSPDLVDVLVCTPGRLIDHLRNTEGFTLCHLQYLVLDEADRLLGQSYSNWIVEVTKHATLDSEDTDTSSLLTSIDNPTSFVIKPRRQATKSNRTTFRKLLFSATLTDNPQQLASLDLVFPKYYDILQLTSTDDDNDKQHSLTKQYLLPEKLVEYTLSYNTPPQKPLILLSYLLQQQTQTPNSLILIFTSSIDTTHRLTRLLQIFHLFLQKPTHTIAEFSSSLTQNQRSTLLQKCRSSNIQILVASDTMSRGLDLANISHVIQYDIPSSIITYVHRCGRTARANTAGKAITLVHHKKEESKLHTIRKSIKHKKGLESVKVSIGRDVKELIAGKYSTCLRVLREVIQEEKTNGLDLFECLDPDRWLNEDDESSEDDGSGGSQDSSSSSASVVMEE